MHAIRCAIKRASHSTVKMCAALVIAIPREPPLARTATYRTTPNVWPSERCSRSNAKHVAKRARLRAHFAPGLSWQAAITRSSFKAITTTRCNVLPRSKAHKHECRVSTVQRFVMELATRKLARLVSQLRTARRGCACSQLLQKAL